MHDLETTPPYRLKKLLPRDIAVVLCNHSTVGEETMSNTGLWLEPTRAVVCSKDKIVGAMTRSAAIGTQWTQDRVA